MSFEKKYVRKECPICGKVYVTLRRNPNKFCSIKCYYKSLQNKDGFEKVTCLYCGKKFVARKSARRKYCSVKCYVESRKKRITRKCLYCGKEFTRPMSWMKNGRGKYCSVECYRKAKTDRNAV